MLRIVLLTLLPAPHLSPPQVEEPQEAPLQVLFADEFVRDSSADYKVQGTIAWVPGRLALSDNATLERRVDCGPRLRLDLKVDSPALSEEHPESEIRIGLKFQQATDCYVRIRHQLENGQSTGTVTLLDTAEEGEGVFEVVVREAALSNTDAREWRVEYRHGLVTVSSGSGRVLAGFIHNGSAPIVATTVSGSQNNVLRQLAAAGNTQVSRPMTERELQQVRASQAQWDELLRLQQAGEYSRATTVGIRLAESIKSEVGESSPDYADIIDQLGLLARELGDYQRAADLHQQAMRIQIGTIGAQHPLYAKSMNNLAGAYAALGKYTLAEPLYERSLAINRDVRGETSTSYANSLNNLSLLYFRQGYYRRAESLLARSVEINRVALGESHPDYAAGLAHLASVCSIMGDDVRAERLYRKAEGITRSALGEEHPQYASSLNSLAGLLRGLGRYTESEELAKRSTAIIRSRLGRKHPDYATSLNNLAGLYVEMGDHVRAEPLYRESLNVRKANFGEHHPDYASSLSNLGSFYSTMGDDDRAQAAFERAREIRESVLGAQHPDLATTLGSLAVIQENRGDYVKAQALHQRALEITRVAYGEEHRAYSHALIGLANMRRDIGWNFPALLAYEEAIRIDRSVIGENHPSHASTLCGLGTVHTRLGNYEEAERVLDQALKTTKASLGEDHPDYALGLYRLGDLYNVTDRSRGAESLYARAAHIVHDNLGINAAIQSERQQKANQAARRRYLDRRLEAGWSNESPPSILLEDVWRWKGAVTLRQRAYRRIASDPDRATVFDAFRAVSRQLSVVSGQAPAPLADNAPASALSSWRIEKNEWERQFDSLSQRREELERRIASMSADYRALRKPLTVASVREHLPPRTAFIDFLDYWHETPDNVRDLKWKIHRRYMAFVVRPDRSCAMIRLGEVTSITEAIDAFRGAVTHNKRRTDSAVRAATILRQQIWEPLEEHLDGITTVIVSPDTALGRVPFAALPGRARQTYLIEEYEFGTMPLAGMLQPVSASDARPEAEKGLLVVGDVDYDAKPVAAPRTEDPKRWLRSAPGLGETGWSSLPGFQQELAIVRDQFDRSFGSSSTTLRGANATESAFMEEAGRHYNLHVVTHGFFAGAEYESVAVGDTRPSVQPSRLARQPAIRKYVPGLLSGLVLAGANNPPSASATGVDGILTASEIETLDLNAVDLVVLSACETGLGETAGGEGLTGLQRAFHVAGARSCIATLWEVPDKATQELMSRFYRYYWEDGLAKSTALRKAQLDILNNRELTRGEPRARRDIASDSGNATRTDPRYWAAFVLSGDWR